MAAQFTETFTNGLSRQTYSYASDSNRTYVVESRKGFAAISGMPQVNGTPNLPVHMRPRKVHLLAQTPQNGKLAHREIPITTAQLITYFIAVQNGNGVNNTVNLDGQSWTVMGYTGEYFHKARG